MDKKVQLQLLVSPELKAKAEAAAKADPYIESTAHFVRVAIAEKIKRGKKSNG
jgi:hypothetical protein